MVEIGQISWMELVGRCGEARSTCNTLNPWIKINKLHQTNKSQKISMAIFLGIFLIGPKQTKLGYTTIKDTSVTFWAEQKKLCHTYDTSMMIIVTKPDIIIDVVGSYFYDKKS